MCVEFDKQFVKQDRYDMKRWLRDGLYKKPKRCNKCGGKINTLILEDFEDD